LISKIRNPHRFLVGKSLGKLRSEWKYGQNSDRDIEGKSFVNSYCIKQFFKKMYH
jgi:hypothetical protein